MSNEMRSFVKPVGTRSANFIGFTDSYIKPCFQFPCPLTKNEYTVKDSFQFAEDICEQDPTLFMDSFDVGSLFTNIPLEETIDV